LRAGTWAPMPVDNVHHPCYRTHVMKTTITAKLKLQTDPAQFQALRHTQLAYRGALNYVSQYAFEHGKMSNKVGLQDGTYAQVRARFKIPAQMACSIPRQVGATYKALWTKVKQNAAARKAGQTKKRYKGLDQPPKYVSPTLTYQLGHDYGFKTAQRVSILTLEGRVVVPYTGYREHVALLHSGKRIVPKANHYARLRKRLQKKGTRAATRRAVVMSGRERRLKQDANHVVSKRIVTRHPHALIGLEELKDIRERLRRKKGKQASKKQSKANAASSKWAFAELHSMIAYKALLHGSMAIKVDAHYTSKACPRCGHTCDANRPHKGLLFVCQNCQYTLHADLVGARNVTMRTLLARQDWVRTGQLSLAPDVSDAEAKAARLRRYAELRWSLDTSPAL
jgi:putative transposase